MNNLQLTLCVAALSFIPIAIRFPVSASTIESAILSRGQTTQDGRLTMIVTTSAGGSQAITIRNNSPQTVIIDQFSVLPANPLYCSGKKLYIKSNYISSICTVREPTETSKSSPDPMGTYYTVSTKSPTYSLELRLVWHEAPRPSPSPITVPTPVAT